MNPFVNVSGTHADVSCPFCGTITSMVLTEREMELLVGGASINEENFPSLGIFDREALITGMCYDCQEATFNKPAPGHEEEWGPMLKECECCGGPLYEKDRISGRLVCKCCGTEN